MIEKELVLVYLEIMYRYLPKQNKEIHDSDRNPNRAGCKGERYHYTNLF
jgi:hypothetical protein